MSIQLQPSIPLMTLVKTEYPTVIKNEPPEEALEKEISPDIKDRDIVYHSLSEDLIKSETVPENILETKYSESVEIQVLVKTEDEDISDKNVTRGTGREVQEMSPLLLPGCSSWSTYSPSLLRTPHALQLEKSRTGNSNVSQTNDKDKVGKENPLTRYRKRPHTGTATNKAWCELAEYKKVVAKRKIEQLKKEMELTEVLIEQNKLKNKLLLIQLERESKNK